MGGINEEILSDLRELAVLQELCTQKRHSIEKKLAAVSTVASKNSNRKKKDAISPEKIAEVLARRRKVRPLKDAI